MKSQLFTKAWELFKKYEMSFSEALKEAWKLVRRELVKIEFSNCTDALKRNELVSLFNSLKPNTFLNFKTREIIFVNTPIKNYESWMK